MRLVVTLVPVFSTEAVAAPEFWISAADVAITTLMRSWAVRNGKISHLMQRLTEIVRQEMPCWSEVVTAYEQRTRAEMEEFRSQHRMQAAIKPLVDDGVSPWIKDVSFSTPVEPLDLVRAASLFDVNVSEEPKLLWIIRKVFSLVCHSFYCLISKYAFIDHGDAIASTMGEAHSSN